MIYFYFRVQKQDTVWAVERSMQNLLHKSGDTVSGIRFFCLVNFLKITNKASYFTL